MDMKPQAWGLEGAPRRKDQDVFYAWVVAVLEDYCMTIPLDAILTSAYCNSGDEKEKESSVRQASCRGIESTLEEIQLHHGVRGTKPSRTRHV
jgi:hypothetical protein